MSKLQEFEKSWKMRQDLGLLQFGANASEALRVFHGAGEGIGDTRFFAVDRFGDHYWITEWENRVPPGRLAQIRIEIVDFLKSKGALSVTGVVRPEQGVSEECQTLYGQAPEGRYAVREGVLRLWVQMRGTRHPGIFLDHQPLREWLCRSMKGQRVLNTFAYTGSLSVAAGVGGASKIVTLDLSKASIQWALENSKLNGISEDSHRLISGDVFEWLPRLRKSGEQFDCIILDPPSFSHGNKGRFSTAKDLSKLHSLALDLLAPSGYLVTSINSANLNWKKYESDVLVAAKEKRMEFKVLKQVDLPETFPTPFADLEARYLKGWILKRTD